MSTQQEYIEDWIGYWVSVSERAMNTWYKTARRIQSRDYRPEDMFSDALDFWTSTTMASWEVLRGSDKRPPLVFFHVDGHDTCTGSKWVRVFSQRMPFKEPSIAWLGPVGEVSGPGVPIDSGALHAQLSDDGTELELKLVGLKNTIDQSLAPATYRAVVHIGEVLVAEVLIVVHT
jgi:hypothetical protein